MSQRRDPPVNLSPRELIKVPQLVFTGIHNSHNNPGHFWLLGFYDEAHSHNRNLNMMLIQVTVKWKIYSYPVAKWICNLTTHTDPPTTTPSSYQYTTLVSQVCKETHTHRRQVNREEVPQGRFQGRIGPPSNFKGNFSSVCYPHSLCDVTMVGNGVWVWEDEDCVIEWEMVRPHRSCVCDMCMCVRRVSAVVGTDGQDVSDIRTRRRLGGQPSVRHSYISCPDIIDSELPFL